MKALQWIEKIQSGDTDPQLTALYGSPEAQRNRYQSLINNYVNLFSEEDDILLLSAPGRTELAGNHTDHQNGRVLCGAVALDTLAAISPTEDRCVHLISQGFGESTVVLENLDEQENERGTTAALIRGVAAALKELGYSVGGFRGYVTSDVPAGGGLSSSASFEILVGGIFSALYNHGAISPLHLAEAGRRAENRHFGKPCGPMDQMACALGGIQMIDFLTPETPVISAIDFSFSKAGYVLCAVDSHTDHADLTEDYAAIPRDMKAVAEAMGESVLRYVNLHDFSRELSRLEKSLPHRCLERAAHFFEEDRRVGLMAAALNNDNAEAYRTLMQASGNSSRWQLQNIVPATQPERRGLEIALERCKAALGGGGAYRVHGGGFAGYVQCLVPVEQWACFCREMEGHYGPGAVVPLQIRPVGFYALE